MLSHSMTPSASEHRSGWLPASAWRTKQAPASGSAWLSSSTSSPNLRTRTEPRRSSISVWHSASSETAVPRTSSAVTVTVLTSVPGVSPAV
jgi:hypothetical protein